MTRPDKSERSRIADVKKSGRDKVLAAYDKIVDKLVEEAKKASVPHAKLCFELLEDGRGKAKDDEEDEDAPSLVEYLIEQLQLQPPPDAGDDSHAETV